MKPELLLTIDHVFHIEKAGLMALHPDFSIPRGFPKEHREEVLLRLPNGDEKRVTAQYNISHFLIRGENVPIDRRWRVTVSLIDTKPEEAPIGTEVLVTSETALKLTQAEQAGADQPTAAVDLNSE